MRKLVAIFGFAFMFTFLLASEVKNISVTGLQNVQAGAVYSLMGLKEGDYYNQTILNDCRRSLLKNGMFSSVEIKDVNGTIKVEVVENQIVNKFEIGDFNGVSRAELEKMVDLQKGSFWFETAKDTFVNRIKSYYEEDGYYNANIDFAIEELENNYINVTLNTEKGERVKVERINFYGNKNFSDDELNDVIKTKTSGWFRSGKYNKETVDLDVERIITFYNEKGYIDVSVAEPEIKPLEDSNRLEIGFYIKPGAKFYLGDVFVTGNIYFSQLKILDKFKFKPDQVFDKQEFESQLFEVYTMYHEEGFVYSKVDYELEKEGGKVNVIITIQENPRAKVHKVIIRGNKRTKEKVVRRKLSVRPGAYYKRSDIVSTQRRIYNTGFFEADMGIDTRVINSSGDMDVIFDLKDRSSNSLNGSIGYNSLDGMVLEASVTLRNLYGNAWQTSASVSWSKTLLNYELDFTNSYLYDTDILGGFSLYNTKREYDDYDWEKRGGSVTLGKYLYWLDLANVKVTYSYYITKYSDLSSDASDELIKEAGKGWQATSSMGISLSRSNKDNVFFPSLGSDFSIYTEFAGSFLGGNENFFKQIYQVSWYLDLPGSFAFRTKWRTGYVESLYSDEEVPPAEKFYIGGMGYNGLRGYGSSSIPDDSDGASRMLIFSSELAYPIVGETFIGLLFYDAGDAVDSYSQLNFNRLKNGAGFGVRFNSPIGIIGLDYGYNLEDNEWKPQFQIGMTF